MRIFAAITTAITLLSCSSLVSAEAPPLIPIQGFLSQADGTPVDGSTALTFRLYRKSEPTGDPSEVLFQEAQDVMVVGGYFTAYLGDKETLPLALFRDNSILFVGIRVNDDAQDLRPLVQLASSPFAAHANSCNDSKTIEGKSFDEIVSAASPKPGTVSSGGIVGPRGPAGPPGPKGDSGLLNVETDGYIKAEMKGQTLSLARGEPLRWVRVGDYPVGSGEAVVGWSDPLMPKFTQDCIAHVTAWLVQPPNPMGLNYIQLAVQKDGVDDSDVLNNEGVPFYGNVAASTTVGYKVVANSMYRFGCRFDNQSGAVSSHCKVVVFCN